MLTKNAVTILLLLLGFSGLAISPVQIEDQAKLELYKHAEIAKVGQRNFTFPQFIKAQDSLDFRPVLTANENLGFTADNFWVRFALHNPGEEAKIYYLETARPITDEVNLFIVDEAGKVIAKKSGDQLVFKDRDFNHRSSIFKLKLQPGKSYRYFLQLGSDGEVISLPLSLRTSTSMITSTYRTELFNGLFYGVLALAAIIYLFFYFGIREKSFLYYGFYILSIGLLQLALDGYVFQYLIPGGGWLNSRMVIIAALISIFFLGRYGETFLKVKESFKWLHYGYRSIYLVAGALFLGIFLSPTALELSYPLSNFTGLILLVLIIGTVVAKSLKGQRVDRFFMAGIGFLVLGFVIFILNNMSVIPNNFVTANSSKIGSGLEVIFLSLSMTNLIRKLRSDKEKSQGMALRKSEEMNEIKNYFMSNMSHELRTPLNAIMGLADQMRNDQDSVEARNKNLDVIKYSSLSLLSSVNDILDFSKIEKGELRLKSTPFNPVQTLKEVSENWKVQAEEKELHYEVDIQENLPETCLGDPDRLAQIANNVLGNAVKFTQSGKVHLRLASTPIDSGHSKLELTITDTGVGITPEKMETVFEAFLQESNNDKRNFGGLGLGLSIVKRLVDLHGGEIELDSNPGQGTTCYISLPYAVIERPKAKPVLNLEEKDLKGAKLLIVEDNALNQMVMKQILGGWKNTAFAVAENGQEALDKMEKDTFDLILMDLQMPVMDGYEASQKIRNGAVNDSYKKVPIVAVTADSMESTREKVFALGINEYLTKPVKGDLLFETVATLIFENNVH